MRRLALNRCLRAALSGALLAAVFVCLLGALLGIDARAQFLPSGCPGQWVQGGGGMMCRCPDGSYANMVGNQIVCPSRAQAQPAVGDYCSSGGTCGVGYKCSWMPGKCVPEGKVDCGTYACESGFKCSSAKCIAQDAMDCGGGRYCNAGYFCGFNGGCVPNGNSECGDHACRPGFTCGSNDICMPEGAVDCGDGRYCPAGSRCEVGRCMGINAVDCGSYSCASGLKCGSGRTCLNRDWVDCGGGKSCAPGQVCVNGGSECLTSAQIADRAARALQQPNIGDRAPVKTNLDRVIEALRDIGVWINDGASKPIPSVPTDVLMVFGVVVLGVAVIFIRLIARPRSHVEQVSTHEKPKLLESDRVPTEGHAASSVALEQQDMPSRFAPHRDSPWAIHSKAGVERADESLAGSSDVSSEALTEHADHAGGARDTAHEPAPAPVADYARQSEPQRVHAPSASQPRAPRKTGVGAGTKTAAIIVNVLFPGFGSFIVGKWGKGIFQLLIGFFGTALIFVPFGLVLGIPICIAVRIWAIITAATAQTRPLEITIINQPPPQT